jgi:hypothetical protein
MKDFRGAGRLFIGWRAGAGRCDICVALWTARADAVGWENAFLAFQRSRAMVWQSLLRRHSPSPRYRPGVKTSGFSKSCNALSLNGYISKYYPEI